VDGITTTIRNHLKTRHGPEYDKIVHTLKLKHSDEVPGLTLATPSRSRAPKFELNIWLQLLIEWIVTDDQVCALVSFVRVEIEISNPSLRPLMWWIIPNSVHGLFMGTTTLLNMIYHIEPNLSR
jgi:hypothetical protein